MLRQGRRLSDVSVIVPTLDSEAYIGNLLTWLQANFVDVVVGVDSKTRDNTRREVQRHAVRMVEVDNDAHASCIFMLEFLSKQCRSEWVLRLDDDEFMSPVTIDYLRSELKSVKSDAVAFHRKWCRVRAGQLEWMAYPLFGLDWQWRLYRKDRVDFYQEVHTPGIRYKSSTFAPSEACIFHLDWVLHSYEFRKKKLAKYEGIREEFGQLFREYYLYEQIPDPETYFVPVWPPSIPGEFTSLLRDR